MNSTELMARWPHLKLPENVVGMHDPNGGILYAKRALDAYKKLSLENGADLRYNAKVKGYTKDKATGDTLLTTHSGEQFRAKHVLVCCGHTQHVVSPSAYSGVSFPMETWHFTSHEDKVPFNCVFLPIKGYHEDA